MKKESEDLRSTLVNRIEELSKELQEQLRVKEACQKKIREVDTRSTQIMGAIHELQGILKSHSSEE